MRAKVGDVFVRYAEFGRVGDDYVAQNIVIMTRGSPPRTHGTHDNQARRVVVEESVLRH